MCVVLIPKALHQCVLVSALILLPMASNAAPSQLLTDAEATAIVESREEAKESRYEAQLAELSRAQIVHSRTVDHGAKQVVINAIKPLVLESSPEPDISEPVSSPAPEPTSEEWAAWIEAQQQTEYISMGATVYGDEYSKITWRDHEAKLSFVVWANISLRYLRFADSFLSGGVRYDYLGLPTTVYTREGVAERLRFAQKYAKEHGIKIPKGIPSFWEEPPYPFSEGQYEYYVIADDPAQVPEKLYRQMNAVLSYYIMEQPRLKIEHLNSETMARARAKFREENPPVPQPTVINFWKIED